MFREMIEKAPCLSHIRVGPVWGVEAPHGHREQIHGNLGYDTIHEIAKGVAVIPSPHLKVSLTVCALDDPTAAALGQAFKTRLEQIIRIRKNGKTTVSADNSFLHIEGGGLGYAMICGMDYYDYTDVRPLLQFCLPWITGVDFDCYLNYRESNLMLEMLAKADSLKELHLNFQDDCRSGLDLHLRDSFVKSCIGNCASLERVMLNYQCRASESIVIDRSGRQVA